MEKIKIYLDYKCFPVWIYNEKDQLITNDLPDYLTGDEIIKSMFVDIQNSFNNLYIDNEKEFKFKGFSSEEKENLFVGYVSRAVNMLKQRVNKSTIVEFDEEDLLKMLYSQKNKAL